MSSLTSIYALCFSASLIISAFLTPLCRWLAIRWDILDHPSTDIKTHRSPTPYLGGLAMALAVLLSLVGARLLTMFPTGTLRSLRGIFLGASIILLLGLIDDITPKGLGYRFKFLVQIVAALCLVAFGIRIDFIHPTWLANLLTVIWVVGIINAMNIIDIMDGLASGVGLIAALGFLFIAFPSEAIYVNFTAAALAGALLGFLPYNLSNGKKIFLGDTGSLLMGFILSALSLGASYTQVNNAAILAPVLLMGVALYDTGLVMTLRLLKGMSPFMGSKDHYALRLERWGLYREEILVVSYAAAVALMFAAYQVTVVIFEYALLIYLAISVLVVLLTTWMARIKMH